MTIFLRIILLPIWLPILLLLVGLGIADDIYNAIVLRSLP